MKSFYEFMESAGANIQKPGWMGPIDASGSTEFGAWFLERNTDRQESPGHGDITTHIVSLIGEEGRVKAFMYADLSDDKNDLYVNYAYVDRPYRRQGVYTSLLRSLSERFRVTSDESHNVDSRARRAYERLGSAPPDRRGRYVLDKRKEMNGSSEGPSSQRSR